MKNKQMTSLIDLFNKQNVQYFAGILQRNMDWPITEIERYYSDLMEDTKIVENGKSKHHFMNGIVIKPLEKTGLLHYISITDGQQRMIVTYLHICAICAFVKNNDIPEDEFNYENIKSTLLINPTQQGDDKYKLLLRQKDRDTIKMIVDELPAHLSKKAGNSPKIITAYNHLYDELNKFNYKETFDKLFLMDTLPFIVEPDEDENSIFDSINTGGRKLSLFDKARSFTLSNYTMKQGELIESKYWEDIAKDKARNTVIRMYSLFSAQQSHESDTYLRFKELSLNYPKMEDFISDISSFYGLYSKIIKANTGNPDLDFLLYGLNLTYSTSEFTGILKIVSYYFENRIDKTVMINSLSLLLSVGLRWKLKVGDIYAFRNMLEYNTLWISPENLYNTLYKKLSPFFISDTQFEMVICDKNFYRGEKGEFEEENKHIPANINKITNYLLISIENNHHGKGRIDPIHYDIEHVCPKKLNEYWGNFFNEEIHHDNVHRLGNLTFLAKEYNRAIGNDSFEDKKNNPNGFKDDKLYLNKSIICYHNWTVDTIQQRTELMAKELCEIFNIPENNLPVKNNSNQSILVGGK